MCRDAIRKAKEQMELNLVRDVKTKKGSFIYIGQKRRAEASALPLIN